ncbi:MAG TPA: universal stress protein [Azospirillum sp.]|nr:universal stress protein [Azospirillum sp.]
MARILTLVDGSAYAQSVSDHAAWAATRIPAAVELVHVLDRRDVSSAPADFTGSLDADAQGSLLAELAEFDAQKAKLAHRRGRLILDAAKARLLAAGVTDVSPRLRNGDVVETVADLEAGADLVVIGKRGEAADVATPHLGSNLERVVRASHRPVLVASRAFQPIDRFLIAFDGGPSVTRAIDDIAQGPLLRGLGCRMLMVGAATPEARERLDRAAERLRGAGFAVDAGIEAGQPDDVIARAVERDGIGLLVMGAYGHSRIRSLIIGSTTTAMIRSSTAPILLFR